MRFWQYDASKNQKELSERLVKYTGGQILLNTKGETLRGPIIDYEESGPEIKFRLLWLARKLVISPSRWYKKGSWKWELIKRPLNSHSCTINVEIENGREREQAGETQSEPLNRKVEVGRFYQNKEWRVWRFHTNPKCLFFGTTTPSERGVLFQPHDPRNLQREGDEILDPFAPKRKT